MKNIWLGAMLGRGPPLIAALVAAVVLLSAGVLMAAYEEHLYSAQQVRNVGEQAQILAASVTAAIVFDDRRAAQEYIEALKVNPELEAAGVYDKSGRQMAEFARGTAQSPPARVAPGIIYGHEFVDVAVPVTQSGARVGTVMLRATTEPFGRRFARYAGLVLLVTMGALVIAVLSLSQAALTRRANELLDVNARLQAEMEERRKTEEALRQSSKMEAIGKLSGGIAHDFNNLIMIAKGNLRMVRKRLEPYADQASRYIVSADEALDRATSLTQRILAFSRRQPLSPTPVSLSDLVAGFAALLHHSVGERVEVVTELKSRWSTLCDINQMENVILNLANNARDAMPDGGLLSVETRDVTLTEPPADAEDFVPGDYVALVVRDTGQGMPDEVRRRAVDPFFTTKPQGKGTGLGLSMAFGFVRQSNGYLVIESKQGVGTGITLNMPRYRKENS